jgi:hypothetical protein
VTNHTFMIQQSIGSPPALHSVEPCQNILILAVVRGPHSVDATLYCGRFRQSWMNVGIQTNKSSETTEWGRERIVVLSDSPQEDSRPRATVSVWVTSSIWMWVWAEGCSITSMSQPTTPFIWSTSISLQSRQTPPDYYTVQISMGQHQPKRIWDQLASWVKTQKPRGWNNWLF